MYEGVSKCFRTGRVERAQQMVQLCAIRCSFIAILWVSLVSFAVITLCVAFQTSNTEGKRIFRYRLSPETFGYALVLLLIQSVTSCFSISFSANLFYSCLVSSFLGSTAQLRPWPPPQNTAEFLGGFSTFFFLEGRVLSPTPNSHPWGPGLCIYIPQRQGGYPF
jgi:hypothetical protein